MTCEDVYVMAGDAIDRDLPASSAEKFYEHLDGCPPCRRSYELELITKTFVRTTIRQIRTPGNVRRDVLNLITFEHFWRDRLSEFLLSAASSLRRPLAFTGIAAASAFAFFYSMTNVPTNRGVNQAARFDVAAVVAQNFENIQRGTLIPDIVATDRESIQRYFRRQGVAFASVLLLPGSTASYGASLTQHDGIPLVHLVYHVGEETIYELEIQERDLRGDNDMHMSAEFLRRLGAVSAVDSQRGMPPIIAWKENETVCIAATTLETREAMEWLGRARVQIPDGR